MSDVKGVFARVLEVSPPPPATSNETTLWQARRTLQRRRWAQAATATAALGVMIAGALVVPTFLGHGNTADHDVTAKQTEPAVPGSARTEADLAVLPLAVIREPAGDDAPGAPGAPAAPIGYEFITAGPEYNRAEAMLAELMRRLPVGYTTPATDTIQSTLDGQPVTLQVKGVQVISRPDGSLEYTAGTDVYRDGEGGTVYVKAISGAAALPPGGDLCARDIGHQGAEDGCRVVTTAGGQQVRLAWSSWHHIVYATFAYEGVTVTVAQTQSGGIVDLPVLTAPIFSDDQLAELAGVTALKP